MFLILFLFSFSLLCSIHSPALPTPLFIVHFSSLLFPFPSPIFFRLCSSILSSPPLPTPLITSDRSRLLSKVGPPPFFMPFMEGAGWAPPLDLPLILSSFLTLWSPLLYPVLPSPSLSSLLLSSPLVGLPCLNPPPVGRNNKEFSFLAEKNLSHHISSFNESTGFGLLKASPVEFVKYPFV